MDEFELIDGSHKYTDVFRVGKRGPGNAYHHYVVRSKGDGVELGQVDYQDGPIGEVGVNGMMDENLIAMNINRLEGFQAGPYAHPKNQEALDHLRWALAALKDRTAEREARGVEGTHTV